MESGITQRSLRCDIVEIAVQRRFSNQDEADEVYAELLKQTAWMKLAEAGMLTDWQKELEEAKGPTHLFFKNNGDCWVLEHTFELKKVYEV